VPLAPGVHHAAGRQAKQDCEINAAKRWLAAHAARYATGNDTLLGDDLYAINPSADKCGCTVFISSSPASLRLTCTWAGGWKPWSRAAISTP